MAVVVVDYGAGNLKSAAKALMENSELSAREVVEKALKIARDICIYTNHNVTIEEL